MWFSRVALWVLFSMMSSVNAYQHAFKKAGSASEGREEAPAPAAEAQGLCPRLQGADLSRMSQGTGQGSARLH